MDQVEKELEEQITRERSAYEMSNTIQDVKRDILGRAEEILNHSIGLAVYGDYLPYNAYEHWARDELAAWFEYLGNLDFNHGKNKLKEDLYKKSLLGIGKGGPAFIIESERDMHTKLLGFNLKVCRKKGYPEFKVTDELAKRVYDLYMALINKLAKMFSEKTYYDEDDYYGIITELFPKKCLIEELNLFKISKRS